MSYKSDGNAEGHGEDWAATDSLGRAPPSSRSITPKGPRFPNLDEARHAISDSSLQLAPSSSSSVNVSDPTGSAGSLPSSRHMELMSSHRPVRQRCLTPFSATASTDAEWTKTRPDPSHIVSGFDFSSSASNYVGTQLHHGTGKENSASLELPDIEDSVEDIYNSYYMQSAADEVRQSRTVSGTLLRNDYPCHSEARIQSVNSYSPVIRRANTDLSPANRAQVYYEPPQMALPKLPDGHQGAKHLTNGSGNWPVNFSRPMRPLNSVSNHQDLMAVPTDSSQTSGLGSHATPTGNPSNTARLATDNLDPEFVIYGSLPAQSDSRSQSLDISSTYSKHPGRTNGALMIGAALDCETMPASIKMAAIGRRKRQHNEANKGLLASPIPREPARAHLKDNNTPTGPVPLGSPTLFSFPPSSLQEAVKRAAIRPANENNLTVTGKSSSMIPSKAIQRTTPPTPHIAKPSTAHSYRPSSASIFGISMTDRGCSEYFEGM